MKWEIVRKEREPIKYVVCNADESEPGTIKDRFIMQQPAQSVGRGMIIAGLVDRGAKGHLVSAHEYGLQEHILEHEIQHATKRACWGKHSGLGLGL